jgi:hypothetical protein
VMSTEDEGVQFVVAGADDWTRFGRRHEGVVWGSQVKKKEIAALGIDATSNCDLAPRRVVGVRFECVGRYEMEIKRSLPLFCGWAKLMKIKGCQAGAER